LYLAIVGVVGKSVDQIAIMFFCHMYG
jgi:hypothetical protein